MTSARTRALASAILRSELHALPAPRTIRAARDLVAALREDGTARGHAAYLPCEELWAYVRPSPGMTDRDLGRALIAGGRMHLVTRNLALLLEIALASAPKERSSEAEV